MYNVHKLINNNKELWQQQKLHRQHLHRYEYRKLHDILSSSEIGKKISVRNKITLFFSCSILIIIYSTFLIAANSYIVA